MRASVADPPSVPRHLHVAFFLHSLDMGGAQRRTLAMAGELAQRGMRVTVLVARDAGPLRETVPAGVSIVSLQCRLTELPWVRARRRRQVRASVPGLIRYLRATRPDVLIAAANHTLLSALLAHRLAGPIPTKLVLRVSNHLSGPGLSRWLRTAAIRRTFNRTTAILAVAEAVANDLRALHSGLTAPVHVLPNPVIGADHLVRAGEKVEHPWFHDGGDPVVLSVGRLVPQKDIATLLRASARLAERRPLRLVIVGDGPERRSLETLCHALGLAARVHFAGTLDNPLPLMRSAKLFVLPSRWEGLPGALIEAMACGCPVVASDCPGGNAEVLLGGRLGRLVPPGDVAALADAMADALDTEPDREALRARASDYTVEAGTSALIDLLWHVQTTPVPSPVDTPTRWFVK